MKIRKKNTLIKKQYHFIKKKTRVSYYIIFLKNNIPSSMIYILVVRYTKLYRNLNLKLYVFKEKLVRCYGRQQRTISGQCAISLIERTFNVTIE